MSDTINQPELDVLIDDCLEGRLDEADAARLSAHLEQSAEARARYWEAASIHGLLENVMQRASLRAVTGQALPIVSKPQRWLQWRPLTAAVMGLVVGLFSASVVFGIVVQRSMGKRLPLVMSDPNFENPQLSLTSGFPGGPAQWGGDAAHVVAAENGVSPKAGQFMLRLEPMTKGVPRIYQVLDLQTLPSDAVTDTREIEISASFAAADSGAAVRYVIRGFAVTDAPEMLDSSWFDRREESIAAVTRGFDVAPGLTGWQTFDVKFQVPRTARSLVLFFGVRTPDKAGRTSPHYLDDVRVSLLVP